MHKGLFCNKFISCLYTLANYWDRYTKMHGQQNVKSLKLYSNILEWSGRSECVDCSWPLKIKSWTLRQLPRDKPVFQNYLGYCWNYITSAIWFHAIWVIWNIACKSTVTKMARMQMFEVMCDELECGLSNHFFTRHIKQYASGAIKIWYSCVRASLI